VARVRAWGGAALAAIALSGPAAALPFDPFEIQVYGPDIDAPGEASLELHLNVAWGGTRVPSWPGQVPPGQAGHYTLEPALGVLEWLELGAYLQTFSAPGAGFQWGGWKLRAKTMVPRRLTGAFFAGLNLEVGRFPASVEEDPWGAEIRPILGWSGGVLSVALNPTFGFALSGPDAFRVELGPAVKVEVDTRLGFGVGLEYYATLGFADALPPPSGWEQLLLVVGDLLPAPGREEGPWELNLGVGYGLTEATPQRWVVKAIVGRSF
jgi:hypothetical protein